jgi:hypothetical protein
LTKLKDRLKAAMAGPILTPEDAERAARAAEALAAYIRAESSAERALALEEAQSSRAPSAGDLGGLKLEDAAERVLDRAGRPMHVRELGTRIKDGGWDHPRSRNPRSDQVNYQLAARLPRDRAARFRRVAPNTFGLVGWDHETRARPKPTFGLFASHNGPSAKETNERFDEVARTPWRS